MRLARSLACGLAAAAVGTLAMDLVWFVRYRRGGGQSDFLAWEFASGLAAWDQASAPAKVGKLLYETALRRELPAQYAQLTTNVMHWAYGVQWGAVLGLAIGSRAHLRLWQGPLFGTLVWLASYVSLPVAGFYRPIWSYDLETLWDDWSAHLVYGTSTAVAFWLTCRP
jgi:hypothetical protein